jgi:serine-type D-Ala-D-Ala carboxypeptidase/endopeptidase (penicillin-binding protein 4)
MCVAGRQHVLDDGTPWRLAARGRVEQRPNLGQQIRQQVDQGPSIVHPATSEGMGREAHLAPRLGPCLAVVLAGLAIVLCSAAPASAARPLSVRLDRALRVPHVAPSRTAALAVDLRSGRVVYSRNASLALIPASNEKLPVAYAALSLLGPGYRFHTEVVGTGALVGDVWHGDLWLRGFGDPTLASSDIDALTAEIASWGIRRVDGAVLADESWFDSRRVGPGWKARFFIGESPPLSALVVDRGFYRGKTSHNPALAAASLLRQALEAHGIHVARRSGRGVLTSSGLPLAQDLSEPLARIVRFMGRESDNYAAEMLVKQIGALFAGRGSTAAGTRVVREELTAAGVPLGGVRLADGSGLSSLNRLTAAAVVALLEAGLADASLKDAFLGCLAVAGVAGTLEHRLQSRPARGRVIAKTGTTNAASALSGFVRDRYAFAVLQNGRPVSSFWARNAQDRFATVLAGAP